MTFHDWLIDNIPHGSTILELGSGPGTGRLAEYFDMVSVEHDPKFMDIEPTRYIFAPIKAGWYDLDRDDLPVEYAAFIVDGPPGRIGRGGLLDNLHLFRADVPWIIDDTHRKPERDLMTLIFARIGKGVAFNGEGDGKKFVVLK